MKFPRLEAEAQDGTKYALFGDKYSSALYCYPAKDKKATAPASKVNETEALKAEVAELKEAMMEFMLSMKNSQQTQSKPRTQNRVHQ